MDYEDSQEEKNVLRNSLMSALALAMTVAFAGGVLAEPSTSAPASPATSESEQLASEEKDVVKPAVLKPYKNTNKMKKSGKGKKAKTPKPAVE